MSWCHLSTTTFLWLNELPLQKLVKAHWRNVMKMICLTSSQEWGPIASLQKTHESCYPNNGSQSNSSRAQICNRLFLQSHAICTAEVPDQESLVSSIWHKKATGKKSGTATIKQHSWFALRKNRWYSIICNVISEMLIKAKQKNFYGSALVLLLYVLIKSR